MESNEVDHVMKIQLRSSKKLLEENDEAKIG